MDNDDDHSSWNPALRPHNSLDDVRQAAPQLSSPPIQDDDADFFDRYAGEQPPAQPQPTTAEAANEEEPSADAPAEHVESELDEPIAIAAGNETSDPVPEASAVLEDAQEPSPEAPPPAESPALIPEPTHDLLENFQHQPVPEIDHLEQRATAEPVESAVQEPEQHVVQEPEQPVSEEPLESAAQTPAEPAVSQADQDVAEQYEYQGQTTAADDAIDESDSAPLIQDEEAPPTPGLASDAPAVNTHDVPSVTVHDDPSALAAAYEHAQQDTAGETRRDDNAEAAQETVPEADEESAAPIGASIQPLPVIAEPVEALEEAKETLEKVAQDPLEQPIRDDVQEPAQVQSQSSAAFEWGDDDGTDDFGAVVGIGSPEAGDKVTSPIAASQETALAEVLQEQEEKGAKNEDDLAALWSAALDDDDFLDDAAVDPSGFFDDDGEGFLDDFDTTPAQAADQVSPGIAPVVDAQGNTTGFTKLGGPQSQLVAPANPYSPQAATQQPSHYQAPGLASMPAVPLYNQAPYQQKPQRPTLSSAQSFADKSKGGYSSPYDLPEDIVQPRRRAPPAAAPSLAQPTAPPPPPRTSSMMSVPGAAMAARPPVSRSATAAPAAAVSSPPTNQSPAAPAPPPKPATAGVDKSASGFFAELPMVPKPRARPSGAYTPVVTSPSPPLPQVPAALQGPPMGPPSRPPSRPVMPPPAGSTSQVLGGLRQPERLPLLPDEPPAAQQLEPPQATGPPATSRYSPAAASGPSAAAPPAAAGRFSPMPPPAPAAAARYSPAPPAQAPSQAQNKYAAVPTAQPARPVQPFAPRTSSPLAYAEKPTLAEAPPPSVRSVSYQPPMPTRQMSGVADGVQTPARRGSDSIDQTLAQSANIYTSPPRTNAYTPMNMSPDSRKSQQPFSPVEARAPSDTFSPPRRPRTQSPGAVMKGPLRAMTQIERPTSAAGTVTSPTTQRQESRATLPPARRQFSADLNYAVPQDERAADPLERYKGCPIFKWSSSGSLISTFPKQAPFYAAGHAIPTIKCTPGSITIHDTKTTFPLNDRDAKFPGPLSKGKSKKKDALTWISGKIEDLERTYEGALLDLGMSTLLKRRIEEKVVLWKMIKLLLENDNKIEGNAAAEEAARKILLPNLAQTGESAEEIADAAPTDLASEPISARAVIQIRKHLLEGQREKAVWYAAEQKLWSHALLIASVAGPEIWKQVVQEFVRSQVKDAGENAQSLATLYEVFAGNWEESIDELVPPSARAGFQMISKVGSSAKNPLDGLDQWRETLGLIISNRSNNDIQAIAALGKLLSSYGRSEAAHTCFLFAKASVQLGGADDPKSDLVLLGADHKNHPQELAMDLDAILLTEVYELAISLAPAAGTSPTIHHLQAYKYQHAQILAEHGLRGEAQAYCDAITAAFKASTRASPYYHAALLSSVDDLSRCLSQAPQTSSSGWIPKPSMDKVSGSMWKRFNTFVAGEDDDQKSTGSGGTEGDVSGPFGKVSGDTPTVSRTTSVTDLYGAMTMNGGVVPAVPGTSVPNRYAPPTQPGGASAARYAPSAYAPSRASIESSRSYEPERPGSGYTATSGLVSPTTAIPAPPLRSSSTPFGAYLPQPVQPVDAQQTPQSLGVPRPEASRAVSDYRFHYSQPPSRRESVQSGISSEPRSSLDQARPAYGYQPQAAQQSPYQPSSYTPSAPLYDDDVRETVEGEEPKGYEPPTQSPYQPSEATPIQGPPASSYTPPTYEPLASSYEPPASSYEPPTSYEPPSSSYEPPTSSYKPPTSYEPPTASYSPSTSYEPPTSSYEPPETSSGGYEPPSDNSTYQPYEPEPDPEDAEQTPVQPKKKSIADDDDDDEFEKRAAALKKAEADKQADEAFRKAAEADAEKDKQSKEAGGKKGWFGGWFGGKKDPNAAPGPIRAKLGEESSFYYDPDLKKWVNKKGGAAAAETSSATPPPPKGPSRAASAAAGPPMSGPPSRAMTPASGLPSGPSSAAGSPAMPSNAFSASAPPPMGAAGGLGGPPSAPPSRPATSMSNASSIDDLLGAPAPRKGGTAKGKKRGGRYVDVMAK